MSELLKINNLIVSFENPAGELTAVKGVSLSLDKGQTLALVGESGCGKTVLCKSMLKILCERGRIKQGEILLDEEDLIPLTEEEMQTRRGGEITMVFQDPMTSLDPAFSVGEQIAEVLRVHKGLGKADAKARAIELMELVKIPEADKRYGQRPYQFSGGMRQRIVIAIALAAEPKILLADEPTTALDEETQEEIIHLLKDVQEKTGVAVLFITHDLSIVEDVADRVAIMKDGKLVEEGIVAEVFKSPKHEYTRKLLGYLDYKKNRGHHHRGNGYGNHDTTSSDMTSEDKRVHELPLISVENLNVRYAIDKKTVNHVLKDFSMDIYRGEIVGLVGRSGCGKSTLARCIMGLEKFEEKRTTRGTDVINIAAGTKIRMIFQDTGAAFNDRMTVGEIIAEPLIIVNNKASRGEARELRSKENLREAVTCALHQVELDESFAERKPYELSGGQRQRVAIARAIITRPDIIIADEPLTGLDVSTQAQIVHLFKKLSKENDMAILFIAHDLPMVNHISDRIINMGV
ncbi:MAG: ABC transporter ATP-binding protein [Bacillota bacterium]|nr:ABC transporter ATP-binding protein [Bacillota bacterium]